MKTNARTAPCVSPDVPVKEPSVNRLRVLGSLAGFALLAAGFNGAYVRPAPTLAEYAVFGCLLGLIFLETVEAGWYRAAASRVKRRDTVQAARQERKPAARETGNGELPHKSKARISSHG